jgi:Mg2+-importing ATPase
MIEVTCSVTRNGTTSEINMNELTVGDIVNLSAGDIVPADIRIISSNNLFVDQSAMTGESESVDKHVILKENENKNPLSCDNLIFMGTSVSSGTAIGVVIAVAQKTFFGKLLLTINKHKVTTEFDRGIEKIS